MTDFSKPVERITVCVPREHAGQRIDSYLPRRFNWRSRQYFRGLLADGTVRVNGQCVKKAFRLTEGDEISLELPEVYRTQFDYRSIPLRVLHEDRALVVVDKPGNLAVQPTGKYIHENLLNRLRYWYRHERDDPQADPCIVHRLDRETSGVIVFAKGRPAARTLSEQFADKRARKTYLAVVHGTPPASGTIEAPLLSTPDRHVVVDRRGKPAVTHYEVVGELAGLTLVKLTLETGRQHQLRVHLAHLGHPIVADELYGRSHDRGHSCLAGRQMLHALRLELTHPDGHPLTCEAPMPTDMRSLLSPTRA